MRTRDVSLRVDNLHIFILFYCRCVLNCAAKEIRGKLEHIFFTVEGIPFSQQEVEARMFQHIEGCFAVIAKIQ